MLTADRLREQVNYDMTTGVFTWKVRRRGVVFGSECGRLNYHGYRDFCIDRTLYRAHRLAFLYVTGEMPSCYVDHVNLVKDDNRWSNLRLCSASQNGANTNLKASNRTGYKGVSFDKERGLWLAQVRLGGKKTNLGRYSTPELASSAYLNAAAKEFGQFLR